MGDLLERDDVDWQAVAEVHEQWKHEDSGIGGPGASLLSLAFSISWDRCHNASFRSSITKRIATLTTQKTIIACILLATLLGCGYHGVGPHGRKPTMYMSVSDMFPDDELTQALAAAAARGDTDRMDELVARGANVNATGEYGFGIGYWVLLHPNKKGFRHLFELGLDPNKVWIDPLDGSRSSLLHKAVRFSSNIGADYLKMALEIGGGDPNLQIPPKNNTPIIVAASRPYIDAFVVLYNNGADIHYINAAQETPFLDAAGLHNYEVAYFLMTQGVNYRQKDSLGFGVEFGINSLLNGGIEYWEKTYPSSWMWFWRFVDMLEKKGMEFDIPPHVTRPKTLDTGMPEFVSRLKRDDDGAMEK